MSAANRIDDVSALSFFKPLHELDHDRLSELAESSPLLSFKKGQPLAAGIEKKHIVYLLAGSVERAPNSDSAEIIKADSERARQPILAPGNRNRVIAQSNVEVLCIDAELLDLLLNWGDGNGLEVDEIDTGDSAGWLNTLMQSEAVLSLSPASIQALMGAVQPVEMKADAVIFQQGDRPDYYYIVSSGRCAITRCGPEQGAPVELATLGPGEAFGEEALIANTERSATVRMTEDGLLLCLDQQNFKQLLEQALVHVIDHDRAQSLKAKGAQLLDLRNSGDFAIDGTGINIPFVELRSRMDELDKEHKYIIMSDDNRASAVAAFLLSQQRFRVHVLLTSFSEEVMSRAAAATAQAGELREQLTQVQQQLDEANAGLAQGNEENARYRERLQTLEVELTRTQTQAKKAIVEAGSLKNKSEATLRERIANLSGELDKERQSSHALNDELKGLKGKLAGLEGQLEEFHQQAGQHSEDSSLMQLRLNNLARELGEEKQAGKALVTENDQLNGRLSQLTRQLDELQEQQGNSDLQSRLDELQAEFGREQAQRQDLAKQNEQLQQRMTTLDVELQQAREQNERDRIELDAAQERESALQEGNKALQVQLEESRQIHEQANEQAQTLHDQLKQAEKEAVQQSDALDDIKTQLERSRKQLEQSEQARATLESGLPQLEAELEQSYRKRQSLEQELGEVKQARTDLEQQKAILTKDLEKQSRLAAEHERLQEKLDSTIVSMAEKELQFAETEAGLEARIQQLEHELHGQGVKAIKESEAARETISRQELRIQVLDKELTSMRDENKRSGLMLKVLLFLVVVLVGALALATYWGIDVQDQTTRIMEQTAPQMKAFFDPILKFIQSKLAG